jgi:hypothetical protein
MSNSRTKLKQADWPLCSKSNVDQTLEQKTRKKSHPKLSVLPIRSSGKCKIQKQNISKIHPSEKHVCDTCKEEIPDISRVLLMRKIAMFSLFSPLLEYGTSMSTISKFCHRTGRI